jgi:hypothetical protein
VLAATGSAVGLGNIWKFPYISGEHGGGAFVLVYLLCIGIIGIPIMMAEVMLGRRGRQSPINTMRTLAEEAGANPRWSWLGWSGVTAGFLILSYYSVIAGWSLAYVFRAMAGTFTGATAEGVASIFEQLTGDPERLLAWHTVFMALTMMVVARGVRSGLEQAVRFLVPALFVLLIMLDGYAMASGAFHQGLEFLFTPDFSKIDANGVLIAMGHAFFTLSLGMGAIMVYGSYMPERASIARTSITIALLDTLVDIPDAADCLRPHGRWVSVWHAVLPAGGIRGLDLGDFADRAGCGLAGGEQGYDPRTRVDVCGHRELESWAADDILVQPLGGLPSTVIHSCFQGCHAVQAAGLPHGEYHAAARRAVYGRVQRLGDETRRQPAGAGYG